MGLVATIGHLLIVWAANNAPASVLAPFQYTEIISSVILGYLVFNDLPAKSTFLVLASLSFAGFIYFTVSVSPTNKVASHKQTKEILFRGVFFVMLALADKPQGERGKLRA